MAGSTGQITLKLKYPIVIESITLDHVSWAIVPEGKHMSAPKRVVVVAYPPCEIGDKVCGSVGFDVNQEFEVARILYNAEGGNSVQTFDSHYGLAIKNLAENPEIDDDDDEEDVDDDALVQDGDDPASCSSEKATSCSVPPRIPAAAVTFRVLENWGDPGGLTKCKNALI
jgi:Sad1 / UNC-like C-terminal